jgi:hypothetical protein
MAWLTALVDNASVSAAPLNELSRPASAKISRAPTPIGSRDISEVQLNWRVNTSRLFDQQRFGKFHS